MKLRTMAAILFIVPIVTFGLHAQQAPTAEAAPVEIGYRGPTWSGASGVSAPTGQKPQSKLWFHDGAWWAAMFSTDQSGYTVWELDGSTQTWTDTGVVVENRNAATLDVLFDGANLYVLSSDTSESASDPIEVRQFSYDPVLRSYTKDSGYPVAVVDGGSEAPVFDRDSQGTLWVTYIRGNSVYVTHSADDGLTWATPFVVPTSGASDLFDQDQSALVAYGGKIGVMWSNQTDDAMYFAVHVDGDPATEWSLNPAIQQTEWADDHLNLKAADDGRVFAATKTSLNGDSDPLVILNVLELDGTWSTYDVATVPYLHTRPIVQLDEDNDRVYVFAASPCCSGGEIYYKTAPMSDISFPPGLGTPIIQSSLDPTVNNVTSSKQPATNESGLLVLAGDDSTKTYLHNQMLLGADTTPPETHIVTSPGDSSGRDGVEFTFISNEGGSTFECRLDGGSWQNCVSPHGLSSLSVGSHTFEVQATDLSANSDPTPATHTWEVVASIVTEFTPVADAHVIQDSPNANTGGELEVDIDGNSGAASTGLVRFDLGGIAGDVLSAALQVDVTNGTGNGPSIATAEPGWTESEVTWNNQPAATGAPFADIGAVSSGQVYELDVTAAAVAGEILDLKFVAQSSDGFAFSSREGTPKPKLVVTSQDVDAPETFLDTTPAAFTTVDSATFVFHGSENATIFECSLDDGPWNECTSPIDYTSLAISAHSFAVRAVDAEGLADPSPASFNWVIDRTPPSVLTMTPADGAADVSAATPVVVDFSEEIRSSTLNGTSFTLTPAGGTPVGATVIYDDGVGRGRLTPTSPLELNTAYVAKLSGVLDLAGNPLPTTSWSFETGNTPIDYLSVPGEYPDIPSAISAASDGDMILVGPGTYPANVVIDKAISLVSQYYVTGDPADIDSTIIQSDGVLDGIVINEGLGQGTTVQGFTLTTTIPDPTSGLDGIRALSSVRIIDNHITKFGDAIDFDPPLDTEETCVCLRNVIENNGDDGIDLDGPASAILEGNILRNNGDDGVEIRLSDWAAPLDVVIRDNEFSDNQQDGVQIIDEAGSSDRRFVIERNVFANMGRAALGFQDNANTTEDYRAASLLDSVHLFNNTFVGNDHAISGGDNVVAVNNIITGNSVGVKGVDGGSIVSHVLYFDNETDELTSNVDGAEVVEGDPQLDGSWVPAETSPAVDAGTAIFSWNDEQVLDIPTTSYSGTAPDLGAFEVTTGPDLTPPETTVDAGPAGSVPSTDATVLFSASEVGSTFECSLDGAAETDCTSPLNLTGLAEGSHTLDVRATDPAGNADPSAASLSWTVDVTTPPAPVIASPVDGASYTFDTFDISGTAEPDAAIEVFDGTASVATTQAGPAGSWSTTLTGVADDTHTYTATATDAAGNASEASAAVTVTVDAKAPDTVIDSGPAAVTNETSATIEFSADEPGVTFECLIDDGPSSGCTSPLTVIELAGGAHLFEVSATDPAGNVDPTPAEIGWTIDLTDPTVLSLTPIDGATGVAPSASVAATFSESLDAASVGQASLVLTDPVGNEVPGTVDYNLATSTVTFNPADLLSSGRTYTAVLDGVSDLVGNPAATTTWSFSTSDAPSESIFTPDADARVVSDNATTSYGDEPSLRSDGSPATNSYLLFDTTGTGDTIESAVLRVFVTNGSGNGPELFRAVTGWDESITWNTRPAFDGGQIGDSASIPAGAWLEFDVTTSIGAPGPHAFGFSSVSSDGTVFDSREGPNPPELVVSWSNSGPDVTPPDTVIDAAPSGAVNQTDATIEFSSSETNSTFLCTVDGAAAEACSSPLSLPGLAEGDHSVDIVATDAAGNSDSTPATAQWTIDVTTPEAPSISGPVDGATFSVDTFDVTGSAEPDATVTLLEGADQVAEVTADAGGAWTITLTGVADGSLSYSATATDAAGNISTASPSVTVTVDAVPPDTSIDSGPSPATNETTAVFEFTANEPVAGFTCALDGADPAECSSPVTLTDLNEGEHTFTVAAYDAAGNADATPATSTWTVDLTAPTASGTPADGETEVAPTVSVSVTFDEAMDEQTITTDTFRLLDGSTPVAASISYDKPSQTATLTPDAVLVGDTTYSVEIADATDLAGNTIAPTSWSFTTTAAPTVSTLSPVDDAYVLSNRATRNYGDDPSLKSDGSPAAASYLKFDATGLGTTIESAILRVYVTNGSGNGPEVSLSETDWDESTVTWESRPATLGGQIGDVGDIPIDAWVEYDLTGSITSPEIYSLRLSSTSSDGTAVNSKEATARQPELVVAWGSGGADTTPPQTFITQGPASTTASTDATFELAASESADFECDLDSAGWSSCSNPVTFTGLAAGAHDFSVRATDLAGNVDESPATWSWTIVPTSTMVLGPTADTYIDEARSSTNYGGRTSVTADGGDGVAKEGLLEFDVNGLAGSPTSVTLRVYVTNSTGNGPEVFAGDTGWDESTVTWDSRPAISGPALADAGAISAGQWYEFDLSGSIDGDGQYSFNLASVSTDAVRFDSREGKNPPQLVIESQ